MATGSAYAGLGWSAGEVTGCYVGAALTIEVAGVGCIAGILPGEIIGAAGAGAVGFFRGGRDNETPVKAMKDTGIEPPFTSSSFNYWKP